MPRIILLVEDNQTDIDLAKRAFEKSNIFHELIVKEDGQDALDFLLCVPDNLGACNAELPSLILLDLKMPRIGGFEVLRQIRANSCTRFIPVVIFTSSGEEKDVIAAYELGASSYICKPVDFKKYADAIQKMSSYWLTLNEQAPRRKQL